MNNKKKQITLVPLVVVLILIIITGAGLFYYKFYLAGRMKHLGKWNRQADLTNYVTESVGKWLGDAQMAGTVNYGDDKVTIKVTLSVDAGGKFAETISEQDYEIARIQAKKIAAAGLESFLNNRLEFANAGSENTGKSVDDLALEALGMTLQEYVDEYAPELIPSREVLQKTILINGTYSINNDIITIVTPGKTTASDYVAGDGYFILSNETEDPTSLGTPIAMQGDVDQVVFNYPVVYTKNKVLE